MYVYNLYVCSICVFVFYLCMYVIYVCLFVCMCIFVCIGVYITRELFGNIYSIWICPYCVRDSRLIAKRLI